MSDFVNQVVVTLTQQLSGLAKWSDQAVIDLQGFFLFTAIHVSAAWQLFLDDLSVMMDFFSSWINSRLDDYPSTEYLNTLIILMH